MMKRLFLSIVVVFVVLFLAISNVEAQRVFYVHAASGNDSNDGSMKAPWRSLEKAREAIGGLKKENRFPARGVIVELTGTFVLHDRGFNLGESDGGSDLNAPVVYRASASGARLIGGRLLAMKDFKPVTDAKVLDRLLPSVRGKVLCCDLTLFGIKEIPPLPRQFSSWRDMELFYGNQAMTVARWPNSGWVEIAKVIDRGVRPVDRATGEWEHGVRGGTFEYKEESPSRWNVSKGVWLNGFWCFDWANETLKVAGIDPGKKTITLEGIHTYGIGNAKSWQQASRRYYALNILEELDAPGEWYVDREEKRLYFIPPGSKEDELVLTTLRAPLIHVSKAKHLRFEGLRMGPTGDTAIGINGASDVLVDSVVVTNTGANAISVTGGKRCGVRNCRIGHIGKAGIFLSGGDRKTLTPCEHFALNNEVHHCGRLQRTGGGYCMVFQGVGCHVAHNLFYDTPYIAVAYGGNDHLFEYNEIHSAMMEGGDGGGIYTGRDWGSQGNVLQYNYFHHFGHAGAEFKTAAGLPLEYEPLKKDVSVMGVYLDDCDSGDTVRSNIFYKAGWAVFVGGGRDNTIENNLMIECRSAVHFDDRGLVRARPGEGTKDGWDLLAKLEAVDFKRPPWSERFPRLPGIMNDDPKLPLHNVVRNNIAINCREWVHISNSAVKTSLARIAFSDNVVWGPVSTRDRSLFPAESSSDRVLFSNEKLPDVESPDKNGFVVQRHAVIRNIAPNFKRIPLEKIGLIKDQNDKK